MSCRCPERVAGIRAYHSEMKLQAVNRQLKERRIGSQRFMTWWLTWQWASALRWEKQNSEPNRLSRTRTWHSFQVFTVSGPQAQFTREECERFNASGRAGRRPHPSPRGAVRRAMQTRRRTAAAGCARQRAIPSPTTMSAALRDSPLRSQFRCLVDWIWATIGPWSSPIKRVKITLYFEVSQFIFKSYEKSTMKFWNPNRWRESTDSKYWI